MRQFLSHSAPAAFMLALFLAAGIAAQNSPSANAEKRAQTDLVVYGDLVDVDVVGGFEFDWRGTLTPEGFLSGFQSYGDPIYALCRTESDIAADIAKVLGKILRDPKVVVKVIDRSGRAEARIDGAIKNPTRFRIKRRVTLRELIVMAGGLTDDASGDIRVLRAKGVNCGDKPAAASSGGQDNGLDEQNIKIADLLVGRKDADIQILSGDLITIERASPVYVIGAVNNPGPLYPRIPMSLTKAIASAGGFRKDADETRISIFRRDSTVIELKPGDLGDELLKPFDIIDVASRGGVRRKYAPVSTAGASAKRDPPPLKVVD